MANRRIDVVVTMLLVAAVEVLLFAAVIVTAVGPGVLPMRTEVGSPAPGSPLPTPSQSIG